MRWVHPEREGRAVRLGYCLNLHPADDLDGLFAGLHDVTVPLRERLGVDREFGVGLYLSAAVAHALDRDPAARMRLAATLADCALDPFTANAFPYGGFHTDGLKQRVFEPTWCDAERVEFTLAVARVLAEVQGSGSAEVLSISTHCGRFGAFEDDEFERAAANWKHVADELARLEERTGRRVRLAFEPEPRSAAGDTREWNVLAARLVAGASAAELERLQRHLGVCLDTCHAAVEFEDTAEAWKRATDHGLSLGKLQFSSALRVDEPGSPVAREALFALDEPRYLHQTTARLRDGALLRALDLPELREACADPASPWLTAEEWRCHFHVPVDLGELAGVPLGTTRTTADELLAVALAGEAGWGGSELAVEIETYTWDVLPGAARGEGELVDGLEREYAHLAARLTEAGWRRAHGTENMAWQG